MRPMDAYGLKFCVLGENHASRTQDAGVTKSLIVGECKYCLITDSLQLYL